MYEYKDYPDAEAEEWLQEENNLFGEIEAAALDEHPQDAVNQAGAQEALGQGEGPVPEGLQQHAQQQAAQPAAGAPENDGERREARVGEATWIQEHAEELICPGANHTIMQVIMCMLTIVADKNVHQAAFDLFMKAVKEALPAGNHWPRYEHETLLPLFLEAVFDSHCTLLAIQLLSMTVEKSVAVATTFAARQSEWRIQDSLSTTCALCLTAAKPSLTCPVHNGSTSKTSSAFTVEKATDSR